MFKTTLTDLTDRRKIESSLRETVDKLEQERGLREQFVSALTHDLRTPLTAARMSAQILANKSNDPLLLPRLSDQIVKNIDRIDHMIQDLLDANRIRAGEKLPMSFTRFDLGCLVKNTLDELVAIHGKRFVLLAQTPVSGNWSKHGLRRVVENLASNAIKYGARHQPVTVSVATTLKDQAIISVHNSGNPIPEEDQSTLFQQFRRAPIAEKGGQKGWGLGLTLVRGIVEAHGGEIILESNRNEGTTFRVLLPLESLLAP